MTKEEAIEVLRIRKELRTRREYATLIKESALQEALGMAIEALETLIKFSKSFYPLYKWSIDYENKQRKLGKI